MRAVVNSRPSAQTADRLADRRNLFGFYGEAYRESGFHLWKPDFFVALQARPIRSRRAAFFVRAEHVHAKHPDRVGRVARCLWSRRSPFGGDAAQQDRGAGVAAGVGCCWHTTCSGAARQALAHGAYLLRVRLCVHRGTADRDGHATVPVTAGAVFVRGQGMSGDKARLAMRWAFSIERP